MKLKKYIGDTTKQALEKMRAELGDDAIVMNTRSLPHAEKPGTMCTEITAAIDEPDFSEPKRTLLTAYNQPKQTTTNSATPFAKDIQRYAENLVGKQLKQLGVQPAATVERERPAQRESIPDIPRRTTSQTQSSSVELAQLQHDIRGVQASLRELELSVRFPHRNVFSGHAQWLVDQLLNAGVAEQRALDITGSVVAEGEANRKSSALRAARRLLTNGVSLANPISMLPQRQVFVFVGPTGSGKTSTISKLAAALKLSYDTAPLLVSTDTFRIGATSHLQTVAAIAGLPFETVYSSQELRNVIKRQTDHDFVLVDTVGRSPHAGAELLEIQHFIEAANPDRTFLVQSCGDNAKYFNNVEAAYTAIGATERLLTKSDESSLGHLSDSLIKSSLPLAYIGTGQAIPDDIEPASRTVLAELLLPGLENVIADETEPEVIIG